MWLGVKLGSRLELGSPLRLVLALVSGLVAVQRLALGLISTQAGGDGKLQIVAIAKGKDWAGQGKD